MRYYGNLTSVQFTVHLQKSLKIYEIFIKYIR